MSFYFGRLTTPLLKVKCCSLRTPVYQDRLSESGPVKRPFCPDWLDCRSREVAHYAKFDHSELARHRDLGLDSNQVGVHAPEEREDVNQEVVEVDTGQQGMTSTKPDVKRG